MKLTNLALLALVTSTAACSQKPQVITLENPAPEKAPGSMQITGSAVLEVSPDCADLTMTLTSDAAKPGAATTGVQQRETALVAALGKIGVETPDIKLSYLTLDPVYSYPENLPARLDHYRASITVTASTKNFGKIGAIMEAGADAGATSLSSAFRRSDISDLKKKVREMALAAAKDKANQTANALDIKLGRIVTVAENSGGMWNQTYFPQVANSMALDARPTNGVALGGTLQPLSLDITISYELAKS